MSIRLKALFPVSAALLAALAIARPVFPAVVFPAASDYTLVQTDPSESSCNSHSNRDLRYVSVFDDPINQRIFIKYELWDLAGWKKAGQGAYKWAIDTAGNQARYRNPSGTQIDDEEFFLFVWDNGTENKMGEVNLSSTGPDGAGSGWPPILGPSVGCTDCVGTGTADLGGPQIANNNPDIGYRLVGNAVEMYVSYSALGSTAENPITGFHDLCIIGAGEGTATNFNLDQASNCDSTVNASGANSEDGVYCGVQPGTVTIVKDTVPDYALGEFRFELQGPSPHRERACRFRHRGGAVAHR